MNHELQAWIMSVQLQRAMHRREKLSTSYIISFVGNTEYKGWDCTDDLKLEKCNDMKVVDGFNV